MISSYVVRRNIAQIRCTLYEAVVRRLPDRSQARNPFFKPGRCFEFDTGWVWQGEIQDRVNATEDLIEDRFWPKAAVKRMAHTASTSALHTVPAAIGGQLLARAGEPAPRRTSYSVDRISGLRPIAPAKMRVPRMVRGIVPRVGIATVPRVRSRHRLRT